MLTPIHQGLVTIAVAATAAAAFMPAPGDDVDPRCRVIRFDQDGRRTETAPTVAHVSGAGSAQARASANGHGSASVSVSASSSSDGSSHASASSRTDGRGRKITTTHNQDGCTIVIDERAAQGARQ